jgi:hypothetical protein
MDDHHTLGYTKKVPEKKTKKKRQKTTLLSESTVFPSHIYKSKLSFTQTNKKPQIDEEEEEEDVAAAAAAAMRKNLGRKF